MQQKFNTTLWSNYTPIKILKKRASKRQGQLLSQICPIPKLVLLTTWLSLLSNSIEWEMYNEKYLLISKITFVYCQYFQPFAFLIFNPMLMFIVNFINGRMTGAICFVSSIIIFSQPVPSCFFPLFLSRKKKRKLVWIF